MVPDTALLIFMCRIIVSASGREDVANALFIPLVLIGNQGESDLGHFFTANKILEAHI